MSHSRKERLALLLQEIIHKYLAPEHEAAEEVTEAKRLLDNYWTSRDATRSDQWNRQRQPYSPKRPNRPTQLP